jgi:hypothetical protein
MRCTGVGRGLSLLLLSIPSCPSSFKPQLWRCERVSNSGTHAKIRPSSVRHRV